MTRGVASAAEDEIGEAHFDSLGGAGTGKFTGNSVANRSLSAQFKCW